MREVPDAGEAQLLVATTDGYFFRFAVDLNRGGECKLQHSSLLFESESEALGSNVL